MLECLILGDSIGHGISSVMRDCFSITEIGISSTNWYKKYHDRPGLDMEAYRFVVISLGTNDMATADIRTHLLKIRQKVQAARIIWVLPSDTERPEQRARVQRLAQDYGDLTVNISDLTGNDHVHPPTMAAYERVAKRIKDTVK
jgi:hypothetical protein